MGRRHVAAEGGWRSWGCGRTLGGPSRHCLCLVGLWGVWAAPVKFHAIWRSFGLGLGSFSPHDWALIWLGSGLSPLGLFCFVQYGVMLCFFAHFECIFYVFHEVKHQNL